MRLQIKELKANQGFDVIEGTITELGDVREFQKFGRPGRVCNGKLKDGSGEVKVTLWNDQIEQVKNDQVVKITNGYTSEWQGQLQVSTGRNGSIEISGEGAPAAAEAAPADTPAEQAEDLELEEEEI